ncbi:AraC family transcriptional regulator [Mammaliicoccus lentus]|uniref:AraC family transcriptional regulator n=1 Tax=Mammaliicoccus lentus TaxID=42858 RepID=UPI002647F1D4|nr:AraC family transcriptional regulator [Mammaliicoccus lentus]
MKNIYEIKYFKYSATKYRNHNGLSFFVVLKGQVMLAINSESTIYREGEIFLLKHNECYKLDVSEGNIVVQIHFYESLLDNLIPELLTNQFQLKNQSETIQLREQLIQLCSIYLTEDEDKNIKILKTLLYIVENIKTSFEFSDDINTISPEGLHPLIEEIKDYIYINYKEKITMNTFTSKYHLSESYFSKMFKEQMGMNFKDYLTDIRLLNSIYDLIHTNEKIIDISEKHGFYNVSAYISSFKLHYGITPKKYRTMFQSENTKFARQNFYNEVDYEKKLSIDEINRYLKYFKTTYINTDVQQDKEMLLLK